MALIIATFVAFVFAVAICWGGIPNIRAALRELKGSVIAAPERKRAISSLIVSSVAVCGGLMLFAFFACVLAISRL
jgi:hypothetical protein